MKVLGRKNRNRLISAFAALIFILFAMTPLVPEAEISSCLMIGALGIDSVGGVVRLTAETSTGEKTETVRGEGVRVTDAIADMNERYGKKAELGHCGVLVMGGDMTADDIGFALMSLLSDAAVSAGCAVVSAAGSAEEFVSSAVKMTTAAGSGVTSYIGFADVSSSAPVPTALEVLSALKSKSAASALPIYSAEENDSETGSSDSQNSGSDGGGAPASGSEDEKTTELVPPRRVRAIGETNFELSESATLGTLLMSPRGKGGLVDARWRTGGAEYLIQGTIESKNGSLTAFYEGASVTAKLKVSAVVRFIDRFIVIEQGGGKNVVDELSSSLEDAFSAALTECLRSAAESSRVTDFLGIRTELYRSCPHEYSVSPPDLSSASVDVEVSVKIR